MYLQESRGVVKGGVKKNREGSRFFSYFVLMFIYFEILSFLSVTFSVNVPASLVLLTTATTFPLNSFICGCVNGSSDVASPLHAAWNVPFPVTSNVSWLSAVGQ